MKYNTIIGYDTVTNNLRLTNHQLNKLRTTGRLELKMDDKVTVLRDNTTYEFPCLIHSGDEYVKGFVRFNMNTIIYFDEDHVELDKNLVDYYCTEDTKEVIENYMTRENFDRIIKGKLVTYPVAIPYLRSVIKGILFGRYGSYMNWPGIKMLATL